MEETMKITSAAFKDGEKIPEKYTCEGENISPPIQWADLPEGTKTLALVCNDPDAPRGGFVHWLIYNIPPARGGFEEGIELKDLLPDGTRQGINNARKIGYYGPCPPSGTHHYEFTLYAIDSVCVRPPGITLDEVDEEIREFIIGEATLTGLYEKKGS